MTNGNGDAIGPYEVVRPLGGPDATPTAWLARRRSDPTELVVVRRFGRRWDTGGDQQGGRRPHDPSQPDAGRRHPSVLQVLDTVRIGTDVMIVTEFAGGGSLRRRLAAGPLEVGETITVLAGAASALADWHSRGEVHGALHPGRVFFSFEGRPVVDAVGADAAAAGLWPGYASPEIARGHSAQLSDDVFALGAIALHCLSGQPAWPADELRDVVIQSVFGQWPTPPAGIPRALALLLTEMLEREPINRPPAADVFRRLADCGPPAPIVLLTAATPDVLELRARPGGQAPVAPSAPAAPDIDAAEPTPPEVSAGPPPAADPAARASSASTNIEREWLTDSANVAEWLRAAVRRPPSPPAEDADHQRTAEGGSPDAPRRVAWPLDRAAVRTVATIVGAVALLAGVWLTVTPGGDATPGSAASSVSTLSTEPGQSSDAAPVPPDWVQVLSRLDGLRAQAFHTADLNLLSEVYASASAALNTDANRISELAAAGYQVPPISHDIRSAIETSGGSAVSSTDDQRVILTVEQAMPAFEIHDSAGGLVGRTIEQAPRRSIITLVRQAGSYRILSVSDAP